MDYMRGKHGWKLLCCMVMAMYRARVVVMMPCKMCDQSLWGDNDGTLTSPSIHKDTFEVYALQKYSDHSKIVYYISI